MGLMLLFIGLLLRQVRLQFSVLASAGLRGRDMCSVFSVRCYGRTCVGPSVKGIPVRCC